VAGSARSLKARARRRRRRAVAATPVVDVPHAEDQMAESQELLKLITQEIDTNKFEDEHWEGSFSQYLERIDENPFIVRTAHQRVYDMVLSYGTEEVERLKRKFVHYKFFDDPIDEGNDALFGLEDSLQRLMNVFKAAAHNFGPERRVLLLHGPVGSSKSTIVRLLKKGLEAYSRSAEGALYTFDWVIEGEKVRSMMNEEPLLLVPPGPRQRLLDHLNEKTRCSYKFKLDFDLSPISRFYYDKLMREYKGDWQKVLEHVQVRRLLISEKDRVGIGTFQPKDEKNQDSTELTGDINYRKIAEYGSDSDPRAFNFDGEFCVANRGMIEFIEVLKLDVAFLYDLLARRQEHKIKPKKFAQTDIDEVIIGHTNEPEYKQAPEQRADGGVPGPDDQDRRPVQHLAASTTRSTSTRRTSIAPRTSPASTSRRTRSRPPRCGPCSPGSKSRRRPTSRCCRSSSSTTARRSRASPRTTCGAPRGVSARGHGRHLRATSRTRSPTPWSASESRASTRSWC
jgi:hypothetical protein